MLWALLYMWLSGGTPAGHTALVPGPDAVRAVVVDPERWEQVVAARKQLRAAQTTRDRALADAYTGLSELLSRRDALPATFAALTLEAETARENAQGAQLDHRFRLKSLLTREEWARLYPP